MYYQLYDILSGQSSFTGFTEEGTVPPGELFLNVKKNLKSITAAALSSFLNTAVNCVSLMSSCFMKKVL